MHERDRYVVKHGDQWAVKAPHAERASGVFDWQSDAIGRAKEIVGIDGRFRDSDTVPPGNDPFPPRDKKH